MSPREQPEPSREWASLLSQPTHSKPVEPAQIRPKFFAMPLPQDPYANCSEEKKKRPEDGSCGSSSEDEETAALKALDARVDNATAAYEFMKDFCRDHFVEGCVLARTGIGHWLQYAFGGLSRPSREQLSSPRFLAWKARHGELVTDMRQRLLSKWGSPVDFEHFVFLASAPCSLHCDGDAPVRRFSRP
jgi:hypothetical protein